MVFSIHQVHFMPGLRFFSKMKNSNIFVYLDDVQYEKREFQNRNRIKTKEGIIYIRVPVLTKNRFNQLIKDVEINNTYNWKDEHLKTITLNYSKAKYFKDYFPEIERIYSHSYRKLIDISMNLINFFREILNIKTEYYFSSQFDIKTSKTQRIVDIAKKISCDSYLSGTGAKAYLDQNLLEKNGIKLIWQEFKIKEYPQLYGSFIPDLSVLDLILNCGPDSSKYL